MTADKKTGSQLLYSASILLSIIVLLSVFSALFPLQESYAHFDHFTHYNGRGGQVPPYYVYEALDPEYAEPLEPTKIMFSVQDIDGNDVYDIQTMVEVYSADGRRMVVFPWTERAIGDFELFYTFPEVGNYQLVLSIANGGVEIGSSDPARTTLSSSLDCECERGIFNVNITSGFGSIYTSTLTFAIVAPLVILGGVLGMLFIKRRKASGTTGAAAKPMSSYESIKYVVMLAAIAGGIVHFAVFSGHASLRLEYSIFLIVAGGMQVAYGIMYVLLTLADNIQVRDRQTAREYYRKTVAINLFGLVGTAVLLGLYAYAVIFPPPLSPNNHPEDIDIAGILAKSLEAFLIVGIVYLMRVEKKRVLRQLAEIR